VGRPILKNGKPRDAADAIIGEIDQALAAKESAQSGRDSAPHALHAVASPI
jgi:hypothetical protein